MTLCLGIKKYFLNKFCEIIRRTFFDAIIWTNTLAIWPEDGFFKHWNMYFSNKNTFVMIYTPLQFFKRVLFDTY